MHIASLYQSTVFANSWYVVVFQIADCYFVNWSANYAQKIRKNIQVYDLRNKNSYEAS